MKRLKDWAETALIAVVEGYIESVDWVRAHPHLTLWGGLTAIAVAAAVF